MIKKTYQVKGIHCKSCKSLIELELDTLAGVKEIKVDYLNSKIELEYDENLIDFAKIYSAAKSLGYEFLDQDDSVAEVKKSIYQKNKFWVGISLAVLLVIIYFIIRAFGGLEIFTLLGTAKLSYGLIFLIGLLASFHCIGMCGGIVMTYTTHYHSKVDKVNFSTPHFLYNSGRLISYTIIGGILGGIGSFFAINPTFSGIVIIVASVLMVFMGLNILTNFKIFKKLSLKTPEFIAKFIYKQKKESRPKGPLIIGLLNGFMPCGPLQAMQLYALTTGSVMQGALSMFLYSLGTIPLMFGFGAFLSMINKDYLKKIVKFSGIVIIILALFMFNRGLSNFGLGLKSLTAKDSFSQSEYELVGDIQEFQTVKMDVAYTGYKPNVLYVKKDVPVRWIINAEQITGCIDEIIMPDYNIKKPLKKGENIVEFTPTKTGEVKFSCWMQMVWGKFIVYEGDQLPNASDISVEDIQPSSCSGNGNCGGTCGQGTCDCKIIKPN